METSEKQRNKSVHVNRTSTSQKKPSQRPKMSEEEKRRRAKFKGKCFRCGATDHMVPQCKLSPNISCNSCKQSGHIATVCERSSTVRATVLDNQPADSNQLQCIHLLLLPSMSLSRDTRTSTSLHRSFRCDWLQLTSRDRACWSAVCRTQAALSLLSRSAWRISSVLLLIRKQTFSC